MYVDSAVRDATPQGRAIAAAAARWGGGPLGKEQLGSSVCKRKYQPWRWEAKKEGSIANSGSGDDCDRGNGGNGRGGGGSSGGSGGNGRWVRMVACHLHNAQRDTAMKRRGSPRPGWEPFDQWPMPARTPRVGGGSAADGSSGGGGGASAGGYGGGGDGGGSMEAGCISGVGSAVHGGGSDLDGSSGGGGGRDGRVGDCGLGSDEGAGAPKRRKDGAQAAARPRKRPRRVLAAPSLQPVKLIPRAAAKPWQMTEAARAAASSAV
ncbi:unnamed protein product, partial [Phaeothamnion confervicola]